MLSRWFLRKEVTWYLEDCLSFDRDGVVLVATLESADGIDANTEGFARPMFQTFRKNQIEPEDVEETTVTDIPAAEKTVSNVFMRFRNEIDDDSLRPTRRWQDAPGAQPQTISATVRLHTFICTYSIQWCRRI